jgi:hypothetical protein
MKNKIKKVEAEVEQEEEVYLNYTIEKMVIIVKDNARLVIKKMMSGEPKNPPPRP